MQSTVSRLSKGVLVSVTVAVLATVCLGCPLATAPNSIRQPGVGEDPDEFWDALTWAELTPAEQALWGGAGLDPRFVDGAGRRACLRERTLEPVDGYGAERGHPARVHTGGVGRRLRNSTGYRQDLLEAAWWIQPPSCFLIMTTPPTISPMQKASFRAMPVRPPVSRAAVLGVAGIVADVYGRAGGIPRGVGSCAAPGGVRAAAQGQVGFLAGAYPVARVFSAIDMVDVFEPEVLRVIILAAMVPAHPAGYDRAVGDGPGWGGAPPAQVEGRFDQTRQAKTAQRDPSE